MAGMRIAVAGGTGVIGRHVVHAARGRGHETIVLTRSTGADLYAGQGIDQHLDGTDVVIDATRYRPPPGAPPPTSSAR